MLEKIKAVNNPLTIIAIFAALAEVAGTVALATVDASLQQTFVWFVMAFPTLIVILFFATLNFNPKVLYAPSDFRNEENFLNTLVGTRGLSLSLEQMADQLEDAKKQILHQAGLQISEIKESERSKFVELLNSELAAIQTQLATARDEAAAVADQAAAGAYPQSDLQASILTALSDYKWHSLVYITKRTQRGVAATERALDRLTQRGLVATSQDLSGDGLWQLRTRTHIEAETASEPTK